MLSEVEFGPMEPGVILNDYETFIEKSLPYDPGAIVVFLAGLMAQNLELLGQLSVRSAIPDGVNPKRFVPLGELFPPFGFGCLKNYA